MNARAAGLFLVLSTFGPGGARADAIAIPDLACPEGAYVSASHGGAWCAARSCETAASCGPSQACEARRVCTRTMTYSEGSRTWPPPEGFDPVRHASVAVASCAPDGVCTGDETGPDRASAPLDPGPASCSVVSVCVPGPPPPTPVSLPVERPGSLCAIGRTGPRSAGLLVVVAALGVALRTRKRR